MVDSATDILSLLQSAEWLHEVVVNARPLLAIDITADEPEVAVSLIIWGCLMPNWQGASRRGLYA